MANVKGTYRRNGKNVYIKQPEYKELAFTSQLWSDEETMKDIGGVFHFEESKWEMFYKKMVQPTDGKNFYCLVYTIRDKAIGEVSFHGFDSITRIARFNVKIHYKYRDKGYGEEALRLLLEYYFLEFGGEMIIDSIPTLSGVRLSEKIGFKEIGQYKDGIKMSLCKNDFLNNKDISVKDIGILMYDNMSIQDYSMVYESLEKFNKTKGKRLFNIHNISFKENIVLSNGLVVNTSIIDMENKKLEVIIIPGGEDVDTQVKDKDILKFLITNLDDTDIICSMGKGIEFLERCRVLEGIPIPRIEATINEREEYMIVDDNFVDNGKVILSANALGNLHMILALVEKLLGNYNKEIMAREIGMFEKNFIKDM